MIYIYIYIGRWEIVSALFVLVFREGETKKNLSPPQGLENEYYYFLFIYVHVTSVWMLMQ